MPPSDFARFVTEYADKYPGKGPGHKRGAPVEWVTIFERHTCTSSVGERAKMVRMHKERWLHLCENELQFPLQMAQQMWEQAIKHSTDAEKSWDGPDRTVRIPMPVEEAVLVENKVFQERGIDMESKKRKLSSEEELVECTRNLSKNHVAFTNDMFKSVGGITAERIAREGSTFLIGS